MSYSDGLLKRIKSFGALQYSIDRIIYILGDDGISTLRDDLKNPDHPAYVMYQAGFNAGRYRLDAEQFKLAEIETKKAKMDQDDKESFLTLRKDLFGV
jgi:hypothetical protein